MMQSEKEYIENEFFVIDSNNLDKISTRLYGFMVDYDKIITDNHYDEIKNITGEGVYVYIHRDKNQLSIFQDMGGSYGLYLYKKNNYFAISNSFLKLVEYLKNKTHLTLNKNYADYYMTSQLCSIVYKSTLVNEINTIAKDNIIHINTKDKSITTEKINYNEHEIELNTEMGLKILDEWFYKWIAIIRSLKSKTNNIQFDLTGGFDSRITLVLLLSSNVDLNKIEIRSFNDGAAGHVTDLEIAGKIAKKFNFNLNNEVISAEKINFKDINTPLQISFYTKLGFQNQLNYKFYKTKTPVYNFNGFAGETIRPDGYDHLTPEQFIELHSTYARSVNPALETPTKKILAKSLKNMKKELKITKEEITSHIYPETRCRTHFGKTAVECIFSNKLVLMPSLDPKLHQLKLKTNECKDEFLLMALIFTRYCPEILEIEFDKNRKIKEETLNYAKMINKIYPFNKKELKFISGPNNNKEDVEKYYHSQGKIKKWEENGEFIKWAEVDSYLKRIFLTKEFKKEFEKYYSQDMYSDISKSFNKGYFPSENSIPAFSVLKIIHDTQFSKYHNNPKISDWFEVYNLPNIKLIKKINELQLFNEEYYESQLLYEIDINPLIHYLEIGWKEGKNPCPQFDTTYYLNKHEDVKKSGVNPLIHYILYGRTENRTIKPDLKFCTISSRALTKEKFDKLLETDNFNEEWDYYEKVINEIKKMDNITRILEINPICPFIEREDIIDLTDTNKENYPIDITNFIKHDCSKVPYPIQNKQYDLVIAHHTLEHLGLNGEQIDIFDELERISHKALITLPYKCFNPKLRDRHMIDKKVIEYWSKGRKPIFEKIYKDMILQIYEFD